MSYHLCLLYVDVAALGMTLSECQNRFVRIRMTVIIGTSCSNGGFFPWISYD